MMENNRLFMSRKFSFSFLCLILAVCSVGYTKPVFKAIEIFPLVKQHVHGSTVVELPNGDILAAWFQGSGERWADDVAIMGARLKAGKQKWSKPFVMADVPEFPDINPILFLDPRGRLWLMWYTVIANQWETSLPKYRISEDFMKQDGAPEWSWQEVLHVKPGGTSERGIQPGDRFVKSIERQIDAYGKYLSQNPNLPEQTAQRMLGRLKEWKANLLAKAKGENMMRRGQLRNASGGHTEQQLGYAYFRRMGWQTKNKAVIVNKNRMIIPFYSDGFSFSLMAITDDCGKNWQFSEPLVGPGNIQPSIAIKADGTLVTYMRDNGPSPKRLHISTSKDAGITWSLVKDSKLPNPGSGADIVTLRNGHWVLSYNDTENGRHSLAVSISTNEGKSWDHTRHLERDMRARNIATSSGYPSITQGLDDTLHVVYSFHHKDRRGEPSNTIKYAQFNEEWIRQE
ncbi:MAG: neuraminidase (sialidase)-like protein [Planctomycetes bacterium]|nr:neuraminidase (sialidase)-like protein [Planctomycetota bacterium]